MFPSITFNAHNGWRKNWFDRQHLCDQIRRRKTHSPRPRHQLIIRTWKP